MPPPSLLQRLKERKLVQWALAYLAGAWVIYEATGTALEAWEIPVLLVRSIHVLLLFGLPLTLILAWYHGEKGRQRVSGPELLMVAALLVVAGVALSMLPGGGETPGPTETIPRADVEDDRPAIAVLPFDNFSPNPDDAYFADGMHEELLSRLGAISSLRVISRSSVERYREDHPAVPEIAADLGAEYLLEGSARIAGGLVRLTVQLIHGETDTHLWSDAFDRDFSVEELIGIQSEIAVEVTSQLAVVVTPEEHARIEALPTQDRAAYDLYLLGRHRFYSRTAEDLHDAIQYFETAVEQDSTYALAWAGIAEAWAVLPWYDPVLSRDAYARARYAAQKALDLEEDLAEGHAALGGLALNHDWDWEQAEAYLSRAVELNPNHAQSYQWLASVYLFQRRVDQALLSIEAGVRLNPLGSNFHGTTAGILFDAGQVEEALAAYRESERLEPQARLALLMMSLILTQEGRAEEAFPVIERWARVVGYPNPERLPLVLRAFETPELTEEALAVLEDVRRTTGLQEGILAALYVNLDAPAEALKILQEAIAQRQVFVPLLAVAPLREKVLENPEIVAALYAAGIAVQ